MANVPVRSEFGEGDFGNELRGQPGHALRARFVSFDRRRLALEPLHLRRQIVELVGGETGTDIALVDQLGILVLSHEQGRERTSLRLARFPPDDHEFLPPSAFYLHPRLTARVSIGGVDLLRDNALLPGLAHGLVQLLARADDVIGDMDRGFGGGKQRFEALLALDVGQFSEILPVQRQEVESVERQRIAFRLASVSALQDLLER